MSAVYAIAVVRRVRASSPEQAREKVTRDLRGDELYVSEPRELMLADLACVDLHVELWSGSRRLPISGEVVA